MNSPTIPEEKIEAAKRAQIRRMGALPPQSARKRCKKGKSCGAACISSSKMCWVDFPWAMSKGISKVRDDVKNRPPYTIVDKGGSVDDFRGKKRIKEVLSEIKNEGATKENGEFKEKDVNWRAALDNGVGYVGGGAFGAFVTVPSERLVKGGGAKFPGGVGVKAGDIGKDEVEAIRKVGAIDIGPKLIAARLSKKDDVNPNWDMVTNKGVIAMSKVPGQRLNDIVGDIGGKSQKMAIMGAAAKLHRIGVSHNDMHGGNIYADANGKVRFVDLGLAINSPKSALAEALREFGSTGNLFDVKDALARRGISESEFQFMRYSYGKSDLGTGGWNKISDRQALQMIDVFYDGIV